MAYGWLLVIFILVKLVYWFLIASESFLNNEGSGLYSLQSMINHSCSPNAEIQFQDSDQTLTLAALKDIQAGEEVYISYLGECELQRSRHSRQKTLK